MDALFSERGADSEVIDALVRANRRKSSIIESLEEQLNRSIGITMYIKSTDGKFYHVEAEQEVSADEIQSKLNTCQAEATELQALLAPAAPAQPEAPAAPAETSAEAPAEVAAPEQPAEQAAPAAPEAPADPNAAPVETPVLQ